MAVVIGLHNIPEGMAVSVPLTAGGMKRFKAVLLTALTGAPTVLGAILGYYLGTLSPIMLAISLSFASGAMLNVSFSELLPESILMWRSKMPAFAVMIGVFVGMAHDVRLRHAPALKRVLQLPVLEGQPCIRVNDVLGRYFYYVFTPEGV